MKINFDLATNFDPKLIERVEGFGTVKDLYGKLPHDIVGGGRPSIVLPDISLKGLRAHIDLAHQAGMKFNYLFNALCMGNRELIGKSHREIRDFIRTIEDTGADRVTVGSALLLGMVKETTPRLEASVSVYNDVDSLQGIQHWVGLGADELTLHYSFNRNFRRLEQALQTTDVNLRIIANNVCLHECPYSANHATALAHSSQTKSATEGFFLDYYSLRCGLDKLENPAKLIAADWIRPEDVHYYEELCDKVGKTNLSFKLTDRARTTDWLVNVVKAYSERSYDGNLFDIINFMGNKGYAGVHTKGFFAGAIKRKANILPMRRYEKAVLLAPVQIDNHDLDGFMTPFVNGHDCSQYVCDTAEGDSGDSQDKPTNSCGYCKSVAKRHLTFTGGESARQEALVKCKTSISDFEKGDLFQ